MSESDGPPYPEARRAYRVLGVFHAILFGAIAFTRAAPSARLVVAAALAIFFGGIALGTFWLLANHHYRGNVPGEPGTLAYHGENDD